MLEDSQIDPECAAIFLVSSYVHDGKKSPEFLHAFGTTCKQRDRLFRDAVEDGFESMQSLYATRGVGEDPALDEEITLSTIRKVRLMYKEACDIVDNSPSDDPSVDPWSGAQPTH